MRGCVCVCASSTGVWSCSLCCRQVRAVKMLMSEGSWTCDTAEGWGPDDTRLCMPPTSTQTIPRHNLHGRTRVSPHAHCVCMSFWDLFWGRRCGVIAHRRVCIPALRDGTTLPSEEWPWTPLSGITLAVPFAKIKDRMASPCLPVAERGACRAAGAA